MNARLLRRGSAQRRDDLERGAPLRSSRRAGRVRRGTTAVVRRGTSRFAAASLPVTRRSARARQWALALRSEEPLSRESSWFQPFERCQVRANAKRSNQSTPAAREVTLCIEAPGGRQVSGPVRRRWARGAGPRPASHGAGRAAVGILERDTLAQRMALQASPPSPSTHTVRRPSQREVVSRRCGHHTEAARAFLTPASVDWEPLEQDLGGGRVLRSRWRRAGPQPRDRPRCSDERSASPDGYPPRSARATASSRPSSAR